ncbi:sulfatase-like hydrolase/transferase [Helicobacter saguini]|uniref:Sulfatase-like hydrolase/transferase n=1 Tax=Helicobacter saguini TaxID=1548018 RepID=A0A347VRZ2_9HELI|nr:sulfatase-like hydrolase/transferase [Helicobacter saguini]MWV62719.1 sulfatase-like hydrolase/transferase [Helicobacter saguini]MWV66610.1 sulfatase-like hydrolase/transferase [Helicobacter saguini]MWV68961.1 sulfatase-like hydrolase/transferase [Helicobacter saguini]MWV71486.1 sulfatase-like hydrolase/transferase [Helicobacter saguini]TLD94128.1 hypothetical protein LS64_007430 [Helicobacter saguini]
MKNRLDSTNKNVTLDKKDSNSIIESKNLNAASINEKDSNDQNFATHKQDSITKWILANISFMLLVFSPLNVYVSGLYEFELEYMMPTILVLFGSFLLLYFSLIYLCSFFNGFRFYKFIVIFFNILLLVGFCYTFIFVGDYGLMSYFIFDKLPSVSKTQRVIDIFVIICCIVLGYFLLKFRFYINTLKVLFIVMFCISSLNIYKVIEYIITHKNMSLREFSQENSWQSIEKMCNIESNFQNNIDCHEFVSTNSRNDDLKTDPVFNFSTTQKNILVIILDRADGYYFKEHYKNHKDLFANFTGFTYFPNAISTSGSTLPTLTSIIAGKYYTAYNINNRKVKDSLSNEIARGYASILNAFYDSNYEVGDILDYPLDYKDLYPLLKDKNKTTYDFKKYDDIYKLIHKDTAFALDDNAKIPLSRLFSIGIFKFVPYFLRPAIYKEGRWFFNTNIPVGFGSYIVMESFRDFISNTASKPTFKFFHLSITHPPYIVDSNCNPTLPTNNHKDTEICAIKMLNQIIEKMKTLDIYDNTQIFILSDHGIESSALPIHYNLTIPFFYKPFNAKGNLKIDSSNIVNYDIASIYCENIANLSPCPNVDSNILKHLDKKRNILTFRIKDWEIEKQGKNEFYLKDFYIFKGGDIYDSKNWESVKESDINKIQNLDSIKH